jgi:hypothetical protein
LGEGADEEDELPALVLGHAVFEGGHRPAAFGYLVKDCAVGDGAHALGVGKIGGERKMRPGFGTVAFATVSVALGAFVGIQLAGELEIGFRGLERIFEGLKFFGNDPLLVLFVGGVDQQKADEGKNGGEEDFAGFEISWRGRGHGSGKILAHLL